jgi:hypothetical protein
MQNADDPRCYVGDVAEATETDDGLAIKGRFDLDTEFGGERYATPTFSCMSTFASQVPTSVATEESDAPNLHDGRLGPEGTLWCESGHETSRPRQL